ncbi:PIN2/TERF1-interacting telomerase inhibitor 1, variant 2 [Schistosoma haematobium]|uniref:PIN2/TERF1-interacting telomerase inhibitor 1, variant 2 n=1 Tax=Schistosoma haematobium TaxID=6185 RepID=A0A922LJZ7_SCHHA|nr:PIN2/TERF1-interacting telomerase inhibitor 1, variant 2 [Schistosoma haematobium]KAH9587640.1 PIN2/TERF1-interacting telomerase inhibitor 1, variant 2 [Schistosoma haematobium]
MLSEKRIKVRYSTDPNGNLWAADPNNFGRKMLEKYGWSPGKGLGKNSNGIKAPIKASIQKGTRGLGMKSDFCLGIRQIDEYASLLRKLNNAHSSSDKTNAISECLPTSWRKGMKTLRSKDASKYDQQDLSIVLGHTRSFLEEKIASPNAPAKESGCQIPSVISPMSVSEYFAKAKKHRLQSEPQTYLVDVKSAKSIEIIVPVDQHVTSNSVSVKINDNEGFECRKIEEISNHEDVELIIPPLDPDKKIRRVETVNAGESM